MLKRNSRKHKYNIAVLHSMYKTNFIFFLSLFFYFSNNNKKKKLQRKTKLERQETCNSLI